MKASEIFWQAACGVSDREFVESFVFCNPDFAVLCLTKDNNTFTPFAIKIREAGFTHETLVDDNVSFDFLHFMSLKAEDDEALAHSIELRTNMQTAFPMIPINKLSDVYLGDNVKLTVAQVLEADKPRYEAARHKRIRERLKATGLYPELK